MVTVGVITTQTVGVSAYYVPIAGHTDYFIDPSQPAGSSGKLTNVYAKIFNDSSVSCTLKWGVYACTSLGGGEYQLTRRSLTTSVSVAAGYSGTRVLTSQSIDIHEGDLIGIEVTFTSSDSGGEFWVIGGATSTNGRILGGSSSGFTDGIYLLSNSDPFLIYGSGTNYLSGGGVGGTPRNACQDVSETMEQYDSSTGLWSVVSPQDFGLSGGDPSAYVNLTFPWDTAGVYTEDEIFVDQVAKSFVNPDNPLEHYTLRMDVFRYTDTIDDVLIDDKSMESTLGTYWTAVNSAGTTTIRTSAFKYLGSYSIQLISQEACGLNGYAGVYQNVDCLYATTTVTFYWRGTSDTFPANTFVFEVIYDGAVVYTSTPANDGSETYWRSATFNITATGTNKQLVFRVRKAIAGTYSFGVFVDAISVTTHSVATGNISNFRECWWIESSNEDVYVNPLLGDDDNLGFSWDEAFETLQKGLTSVGSSGTVHIRCTNVVQTLTSNPSSTKRILPYIYGSYYRIYINK